MKEYQQGTEMSSVTRRIASRQKTTKPLIRSEKPKYGFKRNQDMTGIRTMASYFLCIFPFSVYDFCTVNLAATAIRHYLSSSKSCHYCREKPHVVNEIDCVVGLLNAGHLGSFPFVSFWHERMTQDIENPIVSFSNKAGAYQAVTQFHSLRMVDYFRWSHHFILSE